MTNNRSTCSETLVEKLKLLSYQLQLNQLFKHTPQHPRRPRGSQSGREKWPDWLPLGLWRWLHNRFYLIANLLFENWICQLLALLSQIIQIFIPSQIMNSELVTSTSSLYLVTLLGGLRTCRDLWADFADFWLIWNIKSHTQRWLAQKSVPGLYRLSNPLRM